MDADTTLLNQLSESIDTTQTAYNVNVVYYHTSTDPRSKTLLRSGSPSDNVISVRKPIVLHDSDTLTTNESVALQETNSSRFYADDLNTSTPIYNYVEVEVVVWRR
jgi:murein L,D-transpeptidase YcbB/YkuD